MQSIFRLPWCTDHVSFRAGEKDAYAPPTPPLEISLPKQVKRKRAISSDPLTKQQPTQKRQRPATAIATGLTVTTSEGMVSKNKLGFAAEPVQTGTYEPTAAVDSERIKIEAKQEIATGRGETLAETTKSVETQRSNLQQAIENQLNLQILLKHNELRLIDQELAKCQVALEQLRRCELRPYPGQDRFDHAISTGTGSAVLPSPGHTQPARAAPYGVTDGPYTRHYRRWLLQDDEFDSRPVQIIAHDSSLAGRSTRHAGARKSLPGTLMTSHRQSADFSTMSAAPSPVAKRDSSMPLVLRRSTDNKLVKLVCNNCNRGNMSSIQGFLNHCRIAHKVIYESHDAAAIDCGRALDDAEIASLPAEPQTIPVAKPAVRHAPSRAPTLPTTVPVSTTVHPLNTADAIISKTVIDTNAVEAKPAQSLTATQPSQFAAAPFKAATALPKLSALFARRNAGGNLEQAALDAKRKSDFGADEMISPASLTPGSPAVTTPIAPNASRTIRGVGGKTQAGKSRPRQSYFVPVSAQHDQHDDTRSPTENVENYSPHTAYSNPGLVSDVEDDDNGSASEEETAPHHHIEHPLGIARTCADVADLVEDDLGQHGVIIRRNSMLGADDSLHRDASRKIGGGQR